MDQVVWGMIGCGDVAEVKNGPGLYKAEYSTLRGVYSPSGSSAESYAKRHGVPIVYRRVEDLLADPEINAVYIPTPPRYHKEYALACIQAGKVPYIEKPMAADYEECQDILKAAEAANMPVYVAFYRRGLEKFLKIKKMLEDGCIGTVRCVEMLQMMQPEPKDYLDEKEWRVRPEISGGGKFLDRQVHVLDIMMFLLGPIQQVWGTAVNKAGLYSAEDTLCAAYLFEGGIPAAGIYCYAADRREEYVRITGEKGTLQFEAMSYTPVILMDETGRREFAFEEPQHIGQPYLQLIVNELTGRGRSTADARAAAEVIRVTDQLLHSYRQSIGLRPC